MSASVAWLTGLIPPIIPVHAQSASKPVDFNRDILPILSDNCFTCHGPDEGKRKARLRLDEKEGIFADRGGYQVVVPGRSADSLLFQKITATDEKMWMPPEYSNRKLTPAQIDLIRRWIDEGAPYARHWAYVTPLRPPLLKVTDQSWVRNPIDVFILSRLESEGLKPSVQADKATLLRRVSFDLTGLPPTPAEVDSFLADKSPNAYEKRVDQLLASPHYGEHMASSWLDLARYADSNGYGSDGLRNMWPWRDWVIRAYNQNMPYDQFTLKQIAGDLLPNATLDDKVATGFNRNHMIRAKITRESHAEYVADRVSTVGTTWLGLTVGCARCHDHKYDPIKQKDFYGLFAFFNNVPEGDLSDDEAGNAEPVVSLPTAEQEKRLQELQVQISSRRAIIPERAIIARENRWRQTALLTMPEPPKEGLTAHYELKDNLADTSGNGSDARLVTGRLVYNEGFEDEIRRPAGKEAVFNGETEIDLGQAGDFDRDHPFALALWLRPSENIQKGVELLQKRNSSERWRGYEISLDDPSTTNDEDQRHFFISVRLSSEWPVNAIEVKTIHPVLSSASAHLVVNYDGSGHASHLKIYLDGRMVETQAIKDHLTGSFQSSAPLTIGNKTVGRPYMGRIDDLRFYNRQLDATEIQNLDVDYPARTLIAKLAGNPVQEIASLQPEKPYVEPEIPERAKTDDEEEAPPPGKIAALQQDRLSEYFLTHAASEPDRRAYAELKKLTAEKTKLTEAMPTTMVMTQVKKSREAFVLGRGRFDNPKEKVEPGVPAFLSLQPQASPPTRLSLAKWLVAPENPLTARVEVNRIWQNCFGVGIVKTAEDFGLQGERPSHPELLDWLATEFVNSGWSVKALQRLIVTSATYRQSSRVTPELRERDPENRLLARGPRVRLSAEEIRDNALAVSGLLQDKLGGPGAYPYQPKGLWEEMGYYSGPTTYPQSHGRDLYRRSLYTVWRRSAPPPALNTFDLDRDRCTARRTLTNTPLQALALLNDTTYLEASRALAQRVIQQGGKDPKKRINLAFQSATNRMPEAGEREALLVLLRDAFRHYRQDPASALKLLEVGEWKSNSQIDPIESAAWTAVTRIVLNLDETITKR
jgi:hypothetical protein